MAVAGELAFRVGASIRNWTTLMAMFLSLVRDSNRFGSGYIAFQLCVLNIVVMGACSRNYDGLTNR